MENRVNLETKNLEFVSSNLREFAKIFQTIRKDHFSTSEEKGFKVNILYFKRLSKDKIISTISVNEIKFTVSHDFIFIKSENKKLQRREFCGHLVEEIIANFQPLSGLIFHSDNLNISGLYTLKHLATDKHMLNTLQLNNYNIALNNTEDWDYLSKLTASDNISLSFNLGKDLNDKFGKMLNIIMNKRAGNLKVVIYHENENPTINLNNLGVKFNKLSLDDIRLYLINYNVSSQKLITNEEILQFANGLLFGKFPDFLELNFVEIMNSKNSKVEDGVNLFKFTKIKYTKLFFTVLNSIKMAFKDKLNEKILRTMLAHSNFNDDKVYEVQSQYLKICFPLNKTKPNFLKFIYNLVQDYESILQRKLKYEDIYKIITTKPKEEGVDMIKTLVKLRSYDLNSYSKIMSKIDGNNLLTLDNGTVVSIGGQLKIKINQSEYSIGLNAIIEVNKTYSRIKIYTYKDNYFLSHFHAAATVTKDGSIIVVGGMSIPELFPNFKSTPLYKIDPKSYQIERILPDFKKSQAYPGVIFNHRVIVLGKSILVSDGFVVNNYKGGLNLITTDLSEEPSVKKNEFVFIYDVEENVWKINEKEAVI